MPNESPDKVWVEETPICPGHWVHFDSALPKLLGTTAITPRAGHIYTKNVKKLSQHLHAHEGGHLVQIETLGWPKFAARYVLSIFKPHDDRPLEIDAEAFAVTHEAEFTEVIRP